AVGRWTRGGGGGVSFLAVSEAGDALLGGNSSGDVTWWSPTTGEATPVAAGCANVAKAGVVLGDRALASQIDCPSPMLQIDRRSGALTRSRSLPALDGELPTLHARVLERWGDALVIAGYSPRVDVLSPDRAVHVDGWTVAASPARDLWLLDLDGVVKAVRPDGRVEALASAPGAADLAALGDGVVVIAGRAVTALDASGGVRWTWEAPGDLTRVDAGGGRVVVGDADGQIHVLSDGGALLATARGHRRRISEVRVVGDVAYTASWDATVRRWGLGAAEAPREALIALAGAWGLSVDEAQRAPP
ncbi:MAG TPA: hypothetical protein PKA64_26385, partial [Myxococcota bacterium]|nr:hypothetical protein [Myxococcota bacterium]